MDFYDIEQNTDEWYYSRVGKLTASCFGKVMANANKGIFGEPAKKYAVEIALGQITGNRPPAGYQNEHMQRGHEQEPIARDLYDKRFSVTVTNGGFFTDGFIGCSPDGLVGDDGVIEIKSVIATTHFTTIQRGTFDPSYKWQLIGNMHYTDSNYIDFVSYCSEFPTGSQLYTYRLHKEDYLTEINLMEDRFNDFKVLVSKTKDTILNSTIFN